MWIAHIFILFTAVSLAPNPVLDVFWIFSKFTLEMSESREMAHTSFRMHHLTMGDIIEVFWGITGKVVMA